MTKRISTVSAIWDEEAKVYYCKSDIIGLNIEAETLDEFEIAIADAAPFLVLANHLTKDELARSALEDLIPIILWQRPISQAAA